MNTRRLLAYLLGVACVIGPFATQPLRAQTTKQLAEQRRREMERKRKEFERKSARKMRDAKRSWDKPKSAYQASPSGNRPPKQQSTNTRYVFREGQTLAYAIEIKASGELGKRYWAGVVLMTTKKPTPLRSDGSPHDGAQVALWGHIEGYYQDGDRLERDSNEDITFPETLSFNTTGPDSAGGKRKLPGHMSLRFGLMNGLFPHAPLFATNERSQRKRDYMTQTTYGGFGIMQHGGITGTVDVVKRASGNTTTISETYAGSNKDGSQKVRYALQQTGTFTSSGTLQSSQTSFDFDWENKERIDISVTQVPADKVIAAFSTAKP